jgi:hypothetical protein
MVSIFVIPSFGVRLLTFAKTSSEMYMGSQLFCTSFKKLAPSAVISQVAR